MIDRIMEMFRTVASFGQDSVLTAFIVGVIFGGIIQYTRVDKFEKIAGFAMLKDTIVPKMLFLAIGIASIGLFFMVKAGYAHYHIKPLMLGGLIVGGIIFGVSMAIFGKCPGTGPISVAEGRIDVLVGAFGGLLGGLVFTVFYDEFKVIMGESLGQISLSSWLGNDASIAVFVFGIALIIISILIPKKEFEDEADEKKLEAIRLKKQQKAEAKTSAVSEKEL